MIPHPFQVVDHVHHRGDLLGGILGDGFLRQGDKEIGDFLLQQIDDVLLLLQADNALFVAVLQKEQGFVEHFQGDLAHAPGFGLGLPQSDGRSIEDAVIDIFEVKFHLLIPTADDEGGQLGQDTDQGQEDDGVDDIEERMGIGDMAGNEGLVADGAAQGLGLLLGLDDKVGIAGSDAVDEREKKRQQQNHISHAEKVEQKMGKSRALGGQIGADGGEVGGDGGADILPQNQGHTCFERDQSGTGQSDGDP